jgi:Galactose oxidase, central domain
VRRALITLALLAACNHPAQLALTLRVPEDSSSLSSVASVNMTATRDGVVLASATTDDTGGRISLSGVSFGERTVIALDGVGSTGAVVAQGSTCPLDFEGPGTKASIYFAPVSFFAPTAGAPLVARAAPSVATLDDGTVLFAGGLAGNADAGGTVLGSTELYTPGPGTFSTSSATLGTARWQAQSALLPSIGLFLIGGLDASGNTIADAEIYYEAQSAFLPITNPIFVGRVGHRLVTPTASEVFVSGGSTTDGGDPLTSTVIIDLFADSSLSRVVAGPSLSEARRDHAAAVVIETPIVFGGYGMGGGLLDTIEVLDLDDTSTINPPVANLVTARATATATALSGDFAGLVLVTGGVGASGALASAELFNPATRNITTFTMSYARYGHTATLLPNGDVLIAGGFDANGDPLSAVELFNGSNGFLSEQPLNNPRANHEAVPLCDGTVLIVGGTRTDAEVYTPPATSP